MQDKWEWYWALLPLNAAIGGLSTFIPLYILDVGGSVIDVSLTLSTYNVSLIPGSLLWGYVIDQLPHRKPVIVYTGGGLGLSLVLMLLAPQRVTLSALYGGFGFLVAGISPASQLLVMETFPKSRWNQMVAKTNAISSVGLVLGVLPGVLWTRLFQLRTYLVYLLILAVLATLLFARFLSEPPVVFERALVAHFPETLAARMREIPILFLKMPKVSEWQRFFRLIRSGLTSDIPLLYFAMFLFFSSASLFFTSFTPFLRQNNVPDFDVFLLFSITYCMNAVGFAYSGTMSVRFGEKKAAITAMLVRAFAMAATAVVAFAMSGIGVLLAGVFSAALITLCYSIANTPISTMLYRSLGGGRRGEYLGLYSALTSIGILIGSLVSGYVSYNLSYSVTFLSAAVLVLLAVSFVSRLSPSKPELQGR